MIRVIALGLAMVLAGCAGGAQPEAECASDPECPGGQCVDGVCESLACTDDFQCPLGTLCLGGTCRGLDDNDAGGGDTADDVGQDDADMAQDAGDDPHEDADDAGEDPPDAGVDVVEDVPDAPDVPDPACAMDSDCEADAWCDAEQCVPGCHVDAGCLIGQECDLDTHACVVPGCGGDEDCGPGEMCDLDSGECLPVPVMCLETECADGAWCDFFAESCIDALPGDPCATDADCGELACGLSNDEALSAMPRCLPVVGEGAGRAACQADADCRSGLCLRGACFEACASAEDCDGDQAACATFTVTPSDNGTPAPGDDPSFSVATCVDSLPCTHNGDCPEGQVCGVTALGDDLAASCVMEMGVGVHGSACAADGDCRSGRCEGQAVRRCIGVCATDDDCGPANTACQDLEFPIDEERSETFPVCDWATGSGALCTDHAMCPRDEVCTLDIDSDELRLVCRPPWGADGPGVGCELSNECQTGLCNQGACFGACDQDATCLDGTACFDILLIEGEDAVSMCVQPPPSCASNEDCEDGLICLPFVDEELGMLVPYCLPEDNPGQGAAGAACTANADCASDFCVTFEENSRYCYGVCDAQGPGCADGTRCYPDQIHFTFDQGSPGTLDDRYDATTTCLPDFGSYASCGADAQCGGGEMCFPTLNEFANNFVNRCLDAFNPGGRGPGEACTDASQCASNTCIPDLFGDVCFGTCRSSADCEFGQSCLEVYEFTVNDRGTENDDADDITVGVRQCTNF
jgi:hypothetical protein